MPTDSEIIIAPSDIYTLWQTPADGQDDFSVFPIPTLSRSDFKASVARLNYPETHPDYSVDSDSPLMIRAINFWLSLHETQSEDSDIIQNDIPADFKALTPELLAPIKPHSILLMQNAGDWIVRFMGTDLPDSFGPDLGAGISLRDAPPFAAQHSLKTALDMIQLRPRLCGLRHRGDTATTDMLCVPLYKPDTDQHFILCIAGPAPLPHFENTRESENTAEEQPTSVIDGGAENLTEALSEKLASIQKSLGHFSGQKSASNQTLYHTLAAALDFYQQAQDDDKAYAQLLKSAELKGQKRAPFTPLLKLIFGKDYDKTRLTEYAAALSYAWRQGCSGDEFAQLITDTPGGIKGCVQAERQERKKTRGDFQASSLAQAVDTLRSASAHAVPIENFPFEDFPFKNLYGDEEFSLVIIRKNKNGSHDLIAPYQATPSVLETALRKTAKMINAAPSEAGSPPTAAPSANSQQADQPNAGEKK